jgi:hypothetical protein
MKSQNPNPKFQISSKHKILNGLEFNKEGGEEIEN